MEMVAGMNISEETILSLEDESFDIQPYFFKPFVCGKNIFYSNGIIALKFVGDEYLFDFDNEILKIDEDDLIGDKKSLPAHWLAYVEHLFLTPTTSNGSGNVIKHDEAISLIETEQDIKNVSVSIDNLLFNPYYVKMLLVKFGSFQYKIITKPLLYRFCNRDKNFRTLTKDEHYTTNTLILSLKFIDLKLSGNDISGYGMIAPLLPHPNEKEEKVIQLR